MSTRILRDPAGRARRGLIRTRPHVCGRNCPAHDEAAQAVLAVAKAAKAARHG